jgi:hypothetical protein
MSIPLTHLCIFVGEVSYTAELRPSQGRGGAGSDGGLSVRKFIVLKVISAQEASRRRWMVPKVISAPEVPVSSVVAQWTRVTFLLVGHENICTSQKTNDFMIAQ